MTRIVKKIGETASHHNRGRALKFKKVQPNRGVIVRKIIKYPRIKTRNVKSAGLLKTKVENISSSLS